MRFSFHHLRINHALAGGALLLCAMSSLSAQTRPWWDDYPMIVESTDIATVQSNNGTCGMGSGDPSWGIYVQKAIGDWNAPVQMHNADLKYITYYETFGTATCFILELGPANPEGDSSVHRFYWSWNLADTNGGAFRWAGPQNYFDAEDFAGPYTRLHPVYGAGGRAMTYPDGTPATGYFNNDLTDPRKSRVLDAASSKDILGGITYWLEYRDEVAGNPLRSGGLLPVTVNDQTRLAGHASFAKDAACPMWIDQQHSSILYSVARGQIDGIWTDNFSAWDNFGYPPVKIAFGDWSVARFRTYLSANFSPAQLTAMGVTNVATFDIRAAMRSKLTALGGTDTNLDDGRWNDASWLSDPLWRAYKIFKRQVGTEALTNFYNVSKDAAAQMGVSDFAVMGNDIPVFSLGYCRGTLDAVSTELGGGWHMGTSSRGFMMPSVGRFAPAYKVGREHAKSRLLKVWMYFNNGYEAYKEKPGVVNTLYYEMLANQTLPMLHPGNGRTTQDPAINGPFTSFVQNSRATLSGRDSLTDVGIYYSTSSILAYMTPAGFLDMDNQPHTGAYNGWGTALGNLQYQYCAIPEWKLTTEALTKLRVLIIPNCEVLDSVDVADIIDPWVRAGGLLIVTGNSGARKGESGNFDPHTDFSLSGLTGVTNLSTAPNTRLSTVGSGKVYYIKNNIGLSYFNASTATDRANLISGFSTAMNQVLGTNQTMFAAVNPIPATVGMNVYEDSAARRLFIDVNNYDVNLTTDVVTPTPATKFTVTAPSWLAAASLDSIRVTVLSPTTPAPTVTVTKSGVDRIQVELGAVTNYASVVVSVLTSLTWNGGGGSPSDGSGTWDANSANWWTTPAAVWTDLNNAVFGIGTDGNTPYTVTLGSGFNPTVGNLIFANQSFTLTNGTINLGAASVIQVDAGNATIDSVLAGGSSPLIKTGSGTLVLTGSSTYAGATTVSAGTLQLGDGTTGHDGSINSSSAIVNNATLAFNLSGTAFSYPTISGSGNLVKTGSGNLILNSSNTFTGTTTVNGGTLTLMGSSGWALNGSRAGNNIIVNSGATLQTAYSHQFGFTDTLANITVNSGGTFNGSLGHFIGQLTLNGNATVYGTDYLGLTGGLLTYNGSGSQAGSIAEDLLLRDVPNNPVSATVNVTGTNPAGDLTISGALSGPAGAGLTKTGNGMLVLSGNNAYPGSTSINAGTLKLTGSLHASSAVTVNATLMGTGIVNGPLTIASGGIVAPGASAGTLTAGTTSISGTYACEINGTTADLLNVAGDLTIQPGATLAFSTLSAPTLQSYIIASCAGNLTGTFENVTGTPAGYKVVYDAGLKQIRLERTSFTSWIILHGLIGESAAFSADPDGDGIANGLEYVLGGEPNPANPGSNSIGLLPTLSESAGNFVFSLHRKDVSEPGVALTFQWSTNLIFLSPSSDIPVGATSSLTDGVSVSITEDVPDALTDTINITVPAAKAAGGKIFLRLKATQLP